MRKYKYLLIVGLVLAAISLVLAACSSTPTAEPTKPPPVQEPTQVAAQAGPTAAPSAAPTAAPAAVGASNDITLADIPNVDEWKASPHADVKAEAFNHWNETDNKLVPADCARCHSSTGYQDFLNGAPKDVAIGTVINCQACHSQAAATLTSVKFPSGVAVNDLGPAARCMECHQGRASKDTVDAAVKKAGLTDPDTPSDKLGFVNIHYFAAAATLYGSEVHGAYEYTGQRYDTKFQHVDGFDTCTSCHNPHTTQVQVDQCKACHKNVNSEEDLKNIRMPGSTVDYNGNGDTKEGIAAEIAGMQDLLLQAIQAYGKDVTQKPVAYDAASYPYFFNDTNGNGKVDTDEAKSDNGYKSWTPRLLEAAYNYQTSIKDPGAFAHNAKYTIEYLYDSIADLNTKLSTPVDLSKAHRTDAGHFDATAEAFRHWDEEGVVAAGCAKCHSATGLPQFISEAAASSDGATGIVVSQPLSSGFSCTTCHSDLTTFNRIQVDKVKFPSGAIVSFGEKVDANLCINCHQGRESTVSMNAAITKAGAATDDTVSDKLSFRNPHYFAAGATLFGTEAKGAYEYTGQEYNGRFMHVETMSTCTSCHDAHALTVNVQMCQACHQTVKTAEDLNTIRAPGDTTDYDGNGNNTEGIGAEVKNMSDALYTAIQDYAKTKAGTAIVYDPAAYPYFFADANGNGKVDEGEKAFASWTPRLLRAAYNYQWVNKDPGAFAHNGKYIMQVLYDTLKDLGANVSSMTRPPVVAPTPAATPTKAP